MFNTNNMTVKMNAVTGAILKNHPKSWFERFHLKSCRADRLLKEGTDNSIVVLQMVVCGDMEVIAECVYKKDFNLEDKEGGAE